MLSSRGDRYAQLKDEKARPSSLNSYNKNSRGRYAQLVASLVSLGVFATYIHSSNVCGDDTDKCADYVLSQVPSEIRAAILIFCGGGEFAVASTNCALDVIPQFLNYVDKYTGIQKYLVSIGLIIASMAASLELFFILLKAYDSADEALADPLTILAIIAAFPFTFYGIVNMVDKDIPRLLSYIDYKKGMYKGLPIAEYKGEYEHWVKESAGFKSRVAAKLKAFVPKAKTLVVDDSVKPLNFLFTADLEEGEEVKSTAKKACNWVAKGFFGTIGLASSVGSIVPTVKNSDAFLKGEFGLNDDQTFKIVCTAFLSFIIGLPRIRAVLGKTTMGSVDIADWSLSQDLDYQLYPKLTVASWPLGIAVAYFSYAVVKLAALHNFTGKYQKLMAEFCGASIEYSHLVFYSKLYSQLLSRFSDHPFLYAVQKASKGVPDWTLEQFDDFVNSLTPGDRLLFGIQPFQPDNVMADVEEQKTQLAESKESDVMQSLIQTPVTEANPEFNDALASSVSSSSSTVTEQKPQRAAHQLCSWLSAKLSRAPSAVSSEQSRNLLTK